MFFSSMKHLSDENFLAAVKPSYKFIISETKSLFSSYFLSQKGKTNFKLY